MNVNITSNGKRQQENMLEFVPIRHNIQGWDQGNYQGIRRKRIESDLAKVRFS
jgi:hypothetical protein